MRRAWVAVAVAAGFGLAACSGPATPPSQTQGGPLSPSGSPSANSPPATTASGDLGPSSAPGQAAPTLTVEPAIQGLELPWDIAFLPGRTALVTERGGRLLAYDGTGTSEVRIDLADLFVGSEAGLMGLEVSPDFPTTHQIFLCYATQRDGQPRDVRVARWDLDEAVSSATLDGIVVEGLPISSGRHSGCRLRFAPDGTLLVGAGDAAQSENPQDLTRLGGKVLRVNADGTIPADNPFVDQGPPAAYVYTYGHRNVQGLAVQPGSGLIFSAEHGPSIDDEVNVLQPGANYGWAPGPGYDESVPMTDLDRFPDAVPAIWSSGNPTHATSGDVFLEGPQWGAWDGALAVAELKGSGVLVLQIEGTKVVDQTRMAQLQDTYGRLRSLTLGPDGALWVTTSNGTDDQVLRVTPAD